VENYGRVGLATDNIIRCLCIDAGKSPPSIRKRACTHTHHTHTDIESARICNTCCFSVASVLFVHTLPAFYIVIFKFGECFDEVNSIFSVFVCFIYVYIHIFDLLLYLLILHARGFSAFHGFLECVRNNSIFGGL